MGTVLLSQKMSKIFALLKEKAEECRLVDVFPDLPFYYEEQEINDAEPVMHEFLSEVTLQKLVLPETPSEKSISFSAELNHAPEFLRGALCYEAVKNIRMVEWVIEETEVGDIVLSCFFQQLNTEIRFSDRSFPVSSLVCSSGTVSDTSFLPMFSYICRSGAGNKSLPLTAKQPAGSKRCFMDSDYDGLDERSLKDILSIFGQADIRFDDYLPSGISADIFDCLALQNVSLVTQEEEIQSFSMEIKAKKPLEFLDRKISFIPSFHITINYFGEIISENIYAYGQLKLGETRYEIYVNLNQSEISFSMADGDTLDLTAAAKRLFDIELPDLRFDKLYAGLNYCTHKYMFRLQTSELLKFSVASKEISIDAIALQVWYYASRFSVTLMGKFNICGFPFEVAGSYKGAGSYSLSTCITDNITIKVSDLLEDFFDSKCLLGDTLDFHIDQLSFICSMGQSNSLAMNLNAGFCGSDDTLKKLFGLNASIDIIANKNDKWDFGFHILSVLEIADSQVLTCRFEYDNAVQNKNIITVSYNPKKLEDTITLADILDVVGFSNVDSSWSFITETGIIYAGLEYDFLKKNLSGEITINSGGSFKISITFGEKTEYSIIMSSTVVISLADVPIVGGLTDKFLPSKENFSVKNMTMYVLSTTDEFTGIPAGVRLHFDIFGEKQKWQIYERKPAVNELMMADNASPKVFWLKLDKTVAIFTMHRVGLGLDGSNLMFVLDASLNVSPLAFSLFGAGIGVDLSSFDLTFYITGFGVSFNNETLSISGEFNKNGRKYSGTLLIQVKQISVFAIAEYSEDGSLFAYAVISGRMGGPPAFFITGLALGFGYNKRIALPAIEKVADFPLIKGAMGEIGQEGLLSALDDFISDEQGQKFLAAGVKFTTFEIAESFVLLTVSFGNNFEIDVLGISDITMPPHCGKGVAPIAHAQLALKASFKPEEGFIGVEARLTSESYILSKDCHLTGGFAFYMWFAKERSGDFVITLGGYHPKYALKKPSHYPDVPRVGFNWKIGNNVNICGEAYFALTPSTLMAGGRLSVTYTLGNLKAYFIAKADFLIEWKPFHYDISVGITVGASYLVELWFVSFTVSIELGADLHIWGPDFTGKARISFWVGSFDVSFGANASQKVADLDWDTFCTSFLPKADTGKKHMNHVSNNANNTAPLTISFDDGVNGQVDIGGRTMKSIGSGGFTLLADSVIPIHSARVNNRDVAFSSVTVSVKPMGTAGSTLSTELIITVTREGGGSPCFSSTVITKNVPTALWGGKGELVEDVPCGVLLNTSGSHTGEVIFPKNKYISLDDLYLKGATVIDNAFAYMHPADLPFYTDQNTISTFSSTVDSDAVSLRRESFLKSLGVDLKEKISLGKYAKEAESYLDEEVLIPANG